MKKLLLKSILLLCALVAGSSSVWADNTVTWTISGVNTTASGGSNVNTVLKTSDVSPNTETGVWTAVASTSYAGSNSGAQLGSGSYTFAGTVTLSGSSIPSTAVIKSIDITLSSTGTAYKIDAKVGDKAFGSQVSVNQKDSKTYSFSGEEVGNSIELKFSNGGKKNVVITAISVKYAVLTESDFSISTSSPLVIGMPGSTTGTIEYSTSSTGTITWESDDETVATVVDNNDGTATVTAHTTGSATISATQASDATYAASTTKEITINVTDSRAATTTSINSIGITNTDLKNGTDAGQFTASVTAGGTPVGGATFTWTSSDPTIATIDASGNVTLVKKGTTTIRASYAGDASYAASLDEYELTVADTRQDLEVTADFGYSFFGLTPTGTNTYVQPDVENTSVTYNNVIFNAIKNDGTKVRFDADHMRLYAKNTLTITAPDSYIITSITLVSTGGDWNTGMTASLGTYDDTRDAGNKTYWVGASKSVSFTPAGTHRIASAIVTLAPSVDVTITAAEYATYCNATKALDFSETGITVYTATDGKDYVTLNEVATGKVPANTPVVLYKAGADGSAINVPVIASADAIAGTNDLRVSTGTDVDYMYVLAKKPTIGFYPWAGTNLSAGKVYLQGKASYGAREFLGFSNGETTGVENIEHGTLNMEHSVYDLQGRRVSQPTRGLYIVNGKKVIIK